MFPARDVATEDLRALVTRLESKPGGGRDESYPVSRLEFAPGALPERRIALAPYPDEATAEYLPVLLEELPSFLRLVSGIFKPRIGIGGGTFGANPSQSPADKASYNRGRFPYCLASSQERI